MESAAVLTSPHLRSHPTRRILIPDMNWAYETWSWFNTENGHSELAEQAPHTETEENNANISSGIVRCLCITDIGL